MFHNLVLDINVFIGARSDVGQSDWFWNNKTIMNNSSYLTADNSVCQQIAWPLTYDDGINMRGKDCDSEGYFMCQIKCEFSAISI